MNNVITKQDVLDILDDTILEVESDSDNPANLVMLGIKYYRDIVKEKIKIFEGGTNEENN